VQARRLTIACAQNGLKICQKDSNINADLDSRFNEPQAGGPGYHASG
jgi:hypothetical protein